MLCHQMTVKEGHPGKTPHKRPAFYIDSLIHAREWIAGSSVLGMIHRVSSCDKSTNILYAILWKHIHVFYVTPRLGTQYF